MEQKSGKIIINGEIIHPSPTTMVHFSDGKVVPMNRAMRRKNKIFKEKK